MTKVQIFYDGDPISPSGIGKSQALTATVTQTLSVTVAVPSARFWLAGNGVSSVLATSATLSQGSKSIPITVNGATSFYIPATGRWSDYASIADFDLPGNVTISISFPEEVPIATFGDNTDPDDPVVVSVIEEDRRISPIIDIPAQGVLLFDLQFEGTLNDSVNGLAPTTQIGCSLTTEHKKFGSYGLKLDGGNMELIYELSPSFIEDILSDDFTLHYFISMGDNAWLHVAVVYAKTITGFDSNYYVEGVRFHNQFYTYEELVFSLSTDFIITKLTPQTQYWDCFQIIRGQVWTENFTPPTAPIAALPKVEVTEITFDSTITLTSNPSPGDTLILKGGSGGDVTLIFVDHYPNTAYEIQIGETANETAANIVIAINAIIGAEFVATADGNVITITAYSPELDIETDSGDIDIGAITKTTADIISEEVSAADSFTVTEGGKSVQENASATDAVDGLIDGLSETVSAIAVIDCLMDSMDEGANAADNFDGLIDYMGEET